MSIKTIFFSVIILSVSILKSIAQTDDEITPLASDACVTEPSNIVFTEVEKMPQFKGGDEELFRYLSQNIKYPADAVKDKQERKVFISFVVDEKGKIIDAKVLRGTGKGFDEEALKAIENMPDWIPGRQDGKCVKVQFTLPVSFKL